MKNKKIPALILLFTLSTLSAPSIAGAGSNSSPDAGAGELIAKINRHAIKSALLVRQLLAQQGVKVPAKN